MLKNIFLFAFVICYNIAIGQQPLLNYLDYFGDSDYALNDTISDPAKVKAFYLMFNNSPGDSPDYYFEWVDRLPEMANLSYLAVGQGLDILVDFDRLNSLTKLSRLRLSISDPSKSDFHFSESIINSLTGLDVRYGEQVNNTAALSNLFGLKNVENLSLTFIGDVTFPDSMSIYWPKLKRLRIQSSGRITLPDDLRGFSGLVDLDLSDNLNSIKCPVFLPSSLELLDIQFSSFQTLPDNLLTLPHLKYLNINTNSITSFPERFYFKQLSSFVANEALFSPEQWEIIEKQTTIQKTGNGDTIENRLQNKRQ